MAQDLINNYNVNASDSSSDDDDGDGIEDTLILMFLMECRKRFIEKILCRTSMLSGKNYILEVLVGNPTRCYESFRMQPHVFRNLCDKLKMEGFIHDTREVSVEEGVAMGLAVLCHKVTQRLVAERFQHSLGTVHYWVKTTIRALVSLGTLLIKPIYRETVQPEIRASSKWYPYFEKCIGAIDGTHVASWAPVSKQKKNRGRKACLVTQNIMVVCSHDMMFTFVYDGWEGTANDSRIFLDALTRQGNNFPMPSDDYYYVVDAGYTNVPGFLAPYRGEKYHLNDFRGRGRIRNKHALFNYRHSLLRNIIERAFGVLKARFFILKAIPNYPLRRQKLIPLACCALHNFIRMEDRADRLFTQYGEEGFMNLEEQGGVTQEGLQVDMSKQQQMNVIREAIADQLWANYNSNSRN